ncbi:IS200/IS605 family transposase [Candidatus Margulisiibacteriota bacterium]
MKERKYYHYMFVTYKKRYIFESAVRKYLREKFYDVAKSKKIDIISLAVLGDHVHVLIEQKYNDSPAYIMKCMKGYTSYKLFREYPNMDRAVYRKLWARSYCCREVSASDLKIIQDYIKNQINVPGVDKRFIDENKMEPRRSASGS